MTLVACTDVVVRRDGRAIVDLDGWRVEAGERWVVLGANGSGKTTVLTLCAARLLPSSGTVELLGHRVGAVDLRTLRGRIGLASSSLTRQLRSELTARDVVVGGIDGSLEPWWREATDDELAAATAALAAVGLTDPGRIVGSLSDGERQQVLLARALIADPPLLLADEPSAGLDLGARERLLGRLDALAATRPQLGVVLVTHHVEEIPTSTTHALVLAKGRRLASGPVATVLTNDVVSEAYGLDLELHRDDDGRLRARARR